MMFQNHDSLSMQVTTKCALLEKQASLERQLREANPPRPLRTRLAVTLHHWADRLSPEYRYHPRANVA